MIPNHVLNEIANRLPTAVPDLIEAIAEAVGIDLAAAAAVPLPSIDDAAPHLPPSYRWEGPVIHGAVPFQVRLAMLGEEVTQTCRAVFSAGLIDDIDRTTGEPLRTVGPIEINWQFLDWRNLDLVDEITGEHPRSNAPFWTDDFEGLLPSAVPGLILDMIEQEAIAIEARQKSKS